MHIKKKIQYGVTILLVALFCKDDILSFIQLSQSSFIFSPRHSGETMLPAVVREMKELATHSGINDFSISGTLSSDEWVYQQTLVLLWPRRNRNESKNKFFKTNEMVVSSCKELQKGTEVKLVVCD